MSAGEDDHAAPAEYEPLGTVRRVDSLLRRAMPRTRRDYRILIEQVRVEIAGTLGYAEGRKR